MSLCCACCLVNGCAWCFGSLESPSISSALHGVSSLRPKHLVLKYMCLSISSSTQYLFSFSPFELLLWPGSDMAFLLWNPAGPERQSLFTHEEKTWCFAGTIREEKTGVLRVLFVKRRLVFCRYYSMKPRAADHCAICLQTRNSAIVLHSCTTGPAGISVTYLQFLQWSSLTS